MKKLLLLTIVLGFISCNSEVDYSPREINWDRDICANCLMGIAEQDYTVQAINQYEKVIWFDDLGCLVEYMKHDDWKKFKGDGEVKIWIADCETGQWIDALSAWYRFGDRTPMGFGYGALAHKKEGTFSFNETVKRINAGKTRREEFLKKNKVTN